VTIRLLLRASLAAACVAGALACGVTYVSQVRLARAFATFDKRHDVSRAVADLRASDSVLNPSILRDISISVGLVRTGHPGQAERTMAAAVQREPGEPSAWGILARVQLSRKRIAQARASWVHARRLAPQLPVQLPPPL
jgi:predicted Zn-dependent protease